jgi:hypothetical protein
MRQLNELPADDLVELVLGQIEEIADRVRPLRGMVRR